MNELELSHLQFLTLPFVAFPLPQRVTHIEQSRPVEYMRGCLDHFIPHNFPGSVFDPLQVWSPNRPAVCLDIVRCYTDSACLAPYATLPRLGRHDEPIVNVIRERLGPGEV